MALIWNEKEQAFQVVPGTCPAPFCDAEALAKDCVRAGHCGCDEATKPENQN